MLNYRKVAAAAVIGSLIFSASPVLAEDPLTALMDNIIEVAGEGDDQMTAETEDIQDVQEEAIPEEEINIEAEISEPADSSDVSNPCGRWYALSYEGNSDYRILGEYLVMPDLSVYTPDSETEAVFTLIPSETEGVWEVNVPDEFKETVSSIRLEAGTLTEPVEDDIATFIEKDAGSKCLRLIVTALSKDNPLAGDEDTVTLLLYYSNQYSFLEKWITGKVWKIGDNTLTIGTDKTLDLNGGKATGSCNFTYDDSHSMLVGFRWDGGSTRITYAPSGFTANSLTLTNIDDPSEVMELVCESEAPAAEAESDTAA